MGTDTALAVLSDRPRLLYDYFKQVFAQVTNPPLDAIREELVTTMGSTVGPEGNLLDPQPESCRQIKIKYPVIDNEQLAKLRHVYEPGFRVDDAADAVRSAARTAPGLERAMEELKQRASDAVEAGYTILILSDRERRSTTCADSEPARHGGRAPSSGARRARARAAVSSSSPATRARCTTARCCSATARASSTPTWRSRRSTT